MKKDKTQVEVSTQETLNNSRSTQETTVGLSLEGKKTQNQKEKSKPHNKEEVENKKITWYRRALDYIIKPAKNIFNTIEKYLKPVVKVLSSNTLGILIAISGFIITVSTGGIGAIAFASVIIALKTAQSGISVYKNYKTNQMIAEQEALIEYATARSTQKTLKKFSPNLQNIKSLSTNEKKEEKLEGTKNYYGKKIELVEKLINLTNLATDIATLNPQSIININNLANLIGTTIETTGLSTSTKEQIEDFIEREKKTIQEQLHEIINEERKSGYTVSYQNLKELNEKTRQMEKENLALKDLLKNHDIDKKGITKEKVENQFKQILATKTDKDIKTPVKKYSRLGILADAFVDDMVLKEIEIKENTGITKGQRKTEQLNNIQKNNILKLNQLRSNQQKKHNIVNIKQNDKKKGSDIRK